MALPDILKDRLRIPVVGSPLFIISHPPLVLAQCKAGIVGSFPALNARPAELLEEWLQRITRELDAHNQANPDRPAASHGPRLHPEARAVPLADFVYALAFTARGAAGQPPHLTTPQ